MSKKTRRRLDAVLLAGLLANLAAEAGAALAPNYERTRELIAILSNPDVAQKLGMEIIQSIAANGNEGYRIRTSNCYLDVTLVSAPSSGPPVLGAWQFVVKVGELQCNTPSR